MLSILTENWHTWYSGGVDSESKIRFLNFRPQNQFFDKFGPKNSKLFVLVHIVPQECWFESRFRFLEFRLQYPVFGKFGPKYSKLAVLSENWYTWYLKDADSYFSICFLNLELKINFWANLGQKSQICPFCMKIGTLGFWGCRFLFQD